MPLKFCMWSECLTHLILIPILCRIHSWLSSNDPKKRDNKLKHMHSLWFNLIEFFFYWSKTKRFQLRNTGSIDELPMATHVNRSITPCPQFTCAWRTSTSAPEREDRGSQMQMLGSSYAIYLWTLIGPMSSQPTRINPSVGETWYLQEGYLIPSMSLQTVILNLVSLWKHKMVEWFGQATFWGEVQTLLIFRGLSWMKTCSFLQVLSGSLMNLCKIMRLQYLIGKSLRG